MGELREGSPEDFVIGLDTNPYINREKWDRLPKYVKQYIELVDMRLRESLEKEEALTNNTPAPFFWEEHIPGRGNERIKRFIPDSLYGVTCLLPGFEGRDEGEIRLQVRGERILGVSYSMGSLAVWPHSGNAVLIEPVPRHKRLERLR
jgi:hypothetical protein